MHAMLTKEEKQYLIWLTRERYEGWGAIVELGPWLGASGACLAEGLISSSKPGIVHSFDRFLWDPRMRDAFGADLPEGFDFMPLFYKELGPYASRIEARRCDLMTTVWNGGPIELLFVDAAKTWELSNAILTGFGRALVPDRSRVVFQDFRFYLCYHLPLILHGRPDLWREVESVGEGTTVTFTPLKRLDGSEGVDTPYFEESFPLSVAEGILRSRMEREDAVNRKLIRCSLYMKTIAAGELDKAGRLRAEILADPAAPMTAAELNRYDTFRHLLLTRGWRAYHRQDYATAVDLAESVMQRDPQSAPAMALHTASALKLGNLELAESSAERLLQLHPDHAHAKLYRAELQLARGRLAEGEADAREELERTRPHEEMRVFHALFVLRSIWSQQREPDEVRRLLSDLLQRFPGSPSIFAYRAQVNRLVGRHEEALADTDEARRLQPNDGNSAQWADWAGLKPS